MLPPPSAKSGQISKRVVLPPVIGGTKAKKSAPPPPPPVIATKKEVLHNVKGQHQLGVGHKASAFSMLVQAKVVANGGGGHKEAAPPPPPPPPPNASGKGAGGLPPPPPPVQPQQAQVEVEPFNAKATWRRAFKKAAIIGKGSASQKGEAGRMLHGPYWKEKLDHRNRDSRELNKLRRVWERDPQGGRDFFAWLKTNDDRLPHATQVAQLKTPQQRAPFVANFGEDGSIRMASPQHRAFVGGYTGDMIFAASHDDTVCVGVKNLGKFHHSSFFAGDAVQSAGTMKVVAGKIVEINDHSGHYTPGIPEMKAMVRILQKQGVDVSGITVKTQDTRPMSALDFLKL